MKKQIISGFFIAQGVIFSVSASTAEAATLPPSNPFYFVQDGVRSLRRALAFSPVSRALLELKLVEDRRTDLSQILTAGTDEQAVFAGLKAYDAEVDALAGYAKGAGDSRVLTGVAELFVVHTHFWNDALANQNVLQSVGVRGGVAASRDNLVRLVTETFGQNGHGAFRSRAEAYVAQSNDVYAELYAIDALNGLSFGIASPDMTREVGLFKEDMAIALVGKLKKGAITADKLASIGGDPLIRFYSISAIRDRAGDVETKNVLTLTGQNVIAQAGQARLMTAHEARAAIAYGVAVAAMEGGKSDQGDYFIQQANRFMADSAYDLAFQHGVLASGTATDALLSNTLSREDLRDELLLVKKQYDAVRVKPVFIDKRIAAIADAIGKIPVRETFVAIREVKLVLALLGN